MGRRGRKTWTIQLGEEGKKFQKGVTKTGKKANEMSTDERVRSSVLVAQLLLELLHFLPLLLTQLAFLDLGR